MKGRTFFERPTMPRLAMPSLTWPCLAGPCHASPSRALVKVVGHLPIINKREFPSTRGALGEEARANLDKVWDRITPGDMGSPGQ
jgi:hypothetical protein